MVETSAGREFCDLNRNQIGADCLKLHRFTQRRFCSTECNSELPDNSASAVNLLIAKGITIAPIAERVATDFGDNAILESVNSERQNLIDVH